MTAPTPSGNTCLEPGCPARKPLALPDGVAQSLPAGARLIVKIHYRGVTEAARDQSEVGLYFAKTPPRQTAAGNRYHGGRMP